MDFNRICIGGAGTMGSGIAQLSATSGFDTVLYDLNSEILEKAKISIESSLQKLVTKNKITSKDKEEIIKRIHFTNQIKECASELIIEAIIEDLEAKVELLHQLEKINGSEVIFATNTSSLSVTDIQSKISKPARFIGMHFFNPAPIMKLVEVVRTEKTSNEVVDSIVTLAKRFGKTPVICTDSPGFIVNRVARPFYIESLRLVEETGIDFVTIDHLLEETGFKLGPFKLMDVIGNDVNYSVSQSVYEQLKKPGRLKPSYIQKNKVEKNELGKKTGKGYYTY
jgi:3-hydroxybutyryl-CoA dehydrogenase